MKQEIKQRIEQIKNGEVPQGYKKTKIGIFPNEWEIKYLEEICSTLGGGTPSTKKKTYWNGEVPWISSSDILENDIINVKISRYITTEAIENSSTKIIPRNSILLVSRVGVGKLAIAPVDLCTSQDFTNLINIEGNVFFVASMLQKILPYKIKNLQGTSIQGISTLEIKKCVVGFPPLNEQQKISDILSTQDKVIELKEELLKEKEKQKKYLMQILLTGRKRLKGFNGEWKKVKLKEYLMEISERNKGLKINNVLSVNNKLGFVKQEIQFGKTVASKDLSNYKIIKNNFIAYNPSRINVGSIAIYQGEVQGIVSPMYVVFKTNEMLDSNYFMFFVQSYEFFEKMKSLLSGGVRDSLNFSDLCNMQILLPSLEEQKAISEILTTADKELKLLQEELEEEKRKKKALMQLLLMGIVRI